MCRTLGKLGRLAPAPRPPAPAQPQAAAARPSPCEAQGQRRVQPRPGAACWPALEGGRCPARLQGSPWSSQQTARCANRFRGQFSSRMSAPRLGTLLRRPGPATPTSTRWRRIGRAVDKTAAVGTATVRVTRLHMVEKTLQRCQRHKGLQAEQAIQAGGRWRSLFLPRRAAASCIPTCALHIPLALAALLDPRSVSSQRASSSGEAPGVKRRPVGGERAAESRAAGRQTGESLRSTDRRGDQRSSQGARRDAAQWRAPPGARPTRQTRLRIARRGPESDAPAVLPRRRRRRRRRRRGRAAHQPPASLPPALPTPLPAGWPSARTTTTW